MTKVAIVQSNYVPWKGYFDMLASVDHFILLDDVQFTKNDWRHRNQIKSPRGAIWLSVPVGQNTNRRICDVVIGSNYWQRKHWRTLQANYARAPYYSEVREWLEPLYLSRRHTHLSTLNREFIEAICSYLGIKTTISCSRDYGTQPGRTERLVNLCDQVNGTVYVSGPSAKNYIDESRFESSGIELNWFSYDGYPEYPQLWGKFIHGVTILDMLFNLGTDTVNYMRYVRP